MRQDTETLSEILSNLCSAEVAYRWSEIQLVEIASITAMEVQKILGVI